MRPTGRVLNMMRAVRVATPGGPEALKVENVQAPDSSNLKQNQVLVSVKAAGINPVDTYIRAGTYPLLPPFPYTPGRDGAGIVDAIGANVSNVSVGDRVCIFGGETYAEKAVQDNSKVFRIPDKVSFEQAACLGVPYITAYRALVQKGRPQPGETVFIHGGSGGVGIAAIQLAKSLPLSLKIIASASTEQGKNVALSCGAHHVVNHHDPNHFKEVLELTDGKGVNVILEMLANVNLGNDLPLLSKFGRVVIVGSRGTVEINPRDLMMRDAEVMGMVSGNISNTDMGDAIANIQVGLERGELKPVVACTFSMQEAAHAHEAVMKAGQSGNVVLSLTKGDQQSKL